MYLRRATIYDAELLLKWANDETVRQNSFNTNKITREEHYAWFNGVIKSSDVTIFVLYDKEPVGTVRIKYIDDFAELSYSIGREYRGKGYGTLIIQYAEAEAIKNDKVCSIVAEVKYENVPSQKIFKKLGYTESVCEGHLRYKKQIDKIIGFRVDANAQIASGHAMRCITYAKRLVKKGQSVIFFTADAEGANFIAGKGIASILLDSKYNRLDEELDIFENYIKLYRLDYLIIDSYFATASYLAALQRIVKTVYIDDLLSFAYPVDYIVNYAVYAEEKEYKKLYDGECPKLFLGMEYAPIRDEFKQVKYIKRPFIKNVLITMGGGNSSEISEEIVKVLLKDNRFNNITFHIVVGEFAECNFKNDRVIIHKNVTNMAELMAECDFMISAGGFTLYEAYTVGIPCVSVLIADNQMRNVKKFDEMEAISYMGYIKENKNAVLKNICMNMAKERQ